MTFVYLVLGALAFWAFITVAIFVGSIWAVETWRDWTYRREIGAVIDPLTKAQTDRLVRAWRQ